MLSASGLRQCSGIPLRAILTVQVTINLLRGKIVGFVMPAVNSKVVEVRDSEIRAHALRQRVDAPVLDVVSRARGRKIDPYSAVRVTLGAVLVVAGAHKAYDLATSPSSVGVSWLRNGSFSAIVVATEIVLAVCLLTGIYAHATRLVATVCFGSFAVMSIGHAVEGHPSCGCFGRVAVNPWFTSVFDLIAVAVLSYFEPAAFTRPRVRRRSRKVCAACLGVALILPFAGTIAAGRRATINADGTINDNAQTIVLEPSDWLHQPFPLLKHIDIDADLGSGEWQVIFYHHDCPHCRAAIAGLRTCRNAARARRQLALVEVPPLGPLPHRMNALPRTLIRGRLDADHEWFIVTPSSVVLDDGVVTAVAFPERENKDDDNVTARNEDNNARSSRNEDNNARSSETRFSQICGEKSLRCSSTYPFTRR